MHGLAKDLRKMLPEQGIKRRSITRLEALHKLLLGDLNVRATLAMLLVRHRVFPPQLYGCARPFHVVRSDGWSIQVLHCTETVRARQGLSPFIATPENAAFVVMMVQLGADDLACTRPLQAELGSQQHAEEWS